MQDSNNNISEKVSELVFSEEHNLQEIIQKRNHNVFLRLQQILKVYSENNLGTHHFQSVNGYAHDDLGRDVIDQVFANIFGAQKAAVRVQYVSGTHAIASALYGVLRPGDTLLSVTGKPYETLEEVIGIRGSGQGSLLEFGIKYKEVSIKISGKIDLKELGNALESNVKMVFIQRSCGYSWRSALSIKEIKIICDFIHTQYPNCICFVDNCYGEFVESKEPTQVGADLVAGSLIKNPGGTIVPAGGYIAGNSELVDKASYRLTAPGIGLKGGTSFDLNRVILQGLFLAPQMVAESLIGADIIAGVFHRLGFKVKPLPREGRGDLIQAVCLKNKEALKIVCSSFQRSSPIGSYLNPIPAEMPGYESHLIMAGGTFIDGSTSEFSADAPLREPYNLYVQGGTHRAHIKIALITAIIDLVKAKIVELPNI